MTNNLPFFGMKIEIVEDPTMPPDVFRVVHRRPLTAAEQDKLINDMVVELNRLGLGSAAKSGAGEGERG